MMFTTGNVTGNLLSFLWVSRVVLFWLFVDVQFCPYFDLGWGLGDSSRRLVHRATRGPETGDHGWLLRKYPGLNGW